ncbi:MAG: HIT family protein [Candidatus Nanoarchaeia archaeon]|nr:HIT family protein [Candidatus Nanoarchaeia archaeon]
MDNCTYCKIIRGELPTVKIYENDEFLVIQSLGQTSKGHSLIIPKEHSTNILEMDSSLGTGLLQLIQKIGNACIKGLGAEGFNVGVNTGSVAGQAIMHSHIHIIPRYSEDGLIMWGETQTSEEDRVLFAEKIIKEL